MQRRRNRVIFFVFMVVMTFTFTACGKAKEETKEITARKTTDDGDYVYVPTFEDLPKEKNGEIYGYRIEDGAVYSIRGTQASASIRKKEVTGSKAFQVFYEFKENAELHSFAILPKGQIALVSSYWLEETLFWNLNIVEPGGTEIFTGDITEKVKEGTQYGYVNSVLADADGNIYLWSEGRILVFDKTGAFLFRLDAKELEAGIRSIGKTKDGTIIVMQYKADGIHVEISPIDVAKKDYGLSCQGLPSDIMDGIAGSMAPGLSEDFLICTNSGLMEYSIETESCQEVIKWMECGINAATVEAVSSTAEGNLLLLLKAGDMENAAYRLGILEKKRRSEVPQKEIITLGTMWLAPEIEKAVLGFNETNHEYEVRVINYAEGFGYDTPNELYDESYAKFNMDVMTGNGPDLIDLKDNGYEVYMKKGVVEDLYPYLENSSVVKKEDLNKTLLDSYSVDGKLACIPPCFYVGSYVARKTDVGDRYGWSVDELIELVESRPDAELMDCVNKMAVYSLCTGLDSSHYYDLTTGECHFDSEEFKKVLEFVNRFPDKHENEGLAYWERKGPSEPQMIADGTLLLKAMSIHNFTDVQYTSALFQGDFTYIGYPTTDGRCGSELGSMDIVGIYSKSEHKEGAWKFLEYLLTEEFQRNMSEWASLPSLNRVFEEELAEAMTPQWKLDAEGNQVLDENGNPIEVSTGSYAYADFKVDYYAVTQEEADRITELIAGIDNKGGSPRGDREIQEIIWEEAQPYFAGQKSVDEVTEIMQNRVSLYIKENMN